MSWRCRSVGSYRQRLILATAFSPDGSILAVAASEFLTLWNPATNSLLRVLSNSILNPLQPIHHLAFVNRSNCLVAASPGQRPVLTVWDISTLSLRWCQAISVGSLSVDPFRPSFAVLAHIPSSTYFNGTFVFCLCLLAYCFCTETLFLPLSLMICEDVLSAYMLGAQVLLSSHVKHNTQY